MTEDGGLHCDACHFAALPRYRSSIQQTVESTVGPALYATLRILVAIIMLAFSVWGIVQYFMD